MRYSVILLYGSNHPAAKCQPQHNRKPTRAEMLTYTYGRLYRLRAEWESAVHSRCPLIQMIYSSRQSNPCTKAQITAPMCWRSTRAGVASCTGEYYSHLYAFVTSGARKTALISVLAERFCCRAADRAAGASNSSTFHSRRSQNGTYGCEYHSQLRAFVTSGSRRTALISVLAGQFCAERQTELPERPTAAHSMR